MPRTKLVEDLRGLCLIQTAKFIDQYGPKNFNIQSLPHCLIDNLFCIMTRMNLLSRFNHLDFFLHPNMSKLDLSCNAAIFTDISSSLTLIKQLSKSLTQLSLSSCGISPEELVDLAKFIPGIIILDLSSTKCNDKVLEAIGCNCNSLRDLNVSNCICIRDRGMNLLCVDVNNDQQSRNLKITKLNINNTRITPNGVVIAIKQLPNLQHLEFPDIYRALEIMFQERINAGLDLNNFSLKLNLDHLTMSDGILVQKNLEKCIAICPEVNSMTLPALIMPDENVKLLSRFKNIERLKVTADTNSCYSNLLFSVSVAPLLPHFESSLTTLKLIGVVMVDLDLISRSCRNLLKLALSVNRGNIICPKGNQLDQPFPKLTTLELSRKISTQSLRWLLINCKNLLIFNANMIDALTGSVIREILKLNPLSELTEVTINQCENLRPRSMICLLELGNPLKTLTIFDIGPFYQDDYAVLREYAEENNLDVEVNWNEEMYRRPIQEQEEAISTYLAFNYDYNSLNYSNYYCHSHFGQYSSFDNASSYSWKDYDSD